MKKIPKSIVFMFSGQGSQYYHMGEGLYRYDTVFRKYMDNLDRVILDLLGHSILDIIYDDRKQKSDSFQRLLFSNLAIFMVECSLAKRLIEAELRPDYVLGASIGEFASGVISGVMEDEQALDLLIKKSKVLEEHVLKGGMLTILHDCSLYDRTPLLYENSELAAVNFDMHFTISGKKEGLEQIEYFLKERHILYQTLDVVGAFHSSLMDPVAAVYRSYLDRQKFEPSTVSFISCVTGHEIREFPQYHLWDAVRRPILFQKAIHSVENGRSHIYLDLGPSGTYAAFVEYNLTEESESKSYATLSPFSQSVMDHKRIEDIIHMKY